MKKPISKDLQKYFALTCKDFFNPNIYIFNTKSNEDLMKETKSNDNEMVKMV